MVAKERSRAERAARLFKLAASTTRAAILLALQKYKEMPVQDIAEELGMTHSAVSHQLGLLSAAKIVQFKRSGRHMRYRLAESPQAKSLAKFLSTL